jgi:hypothetical protein
VRNVSVCTVNRSAAQIACAWACKNVPQVWLGGRGAPAGAAARAIAGGHAQLEELAADALGAPQAVLFREATDQVPHLVGQPRPPRGPPRGPAGVPPPEEAPAPPVPAEHRLRPHQHQVPAPVGTQALHHDPEQPVVPAHAGPPTGVQRHRDLLPQEQVLQQQRAAITERPAEDAGEERHASEHEAMNADHVVCRVSAPRMEFSRPTAARTRRRR